MIITITGDLGAGKSMLAKHCARMLGYTHYSSGDLFRGLAKDRGLTLMELTRLSEEDESIDRGVDEYVAKLGERGDDFVVDSRLAWHFIPISYKIFLEVEPEVGAERIFFSQRPEERASSLEEMLNANKERERSEEQRYLKRYGIRLRDPDNYDLWLDTTCIPPEKIARRVYVKLFEDAPPKSL